jgi:hypothetical protein
MIMDLLEQVPLEQVPPEFARSFLLTLFRSEPKSPGTMVIELRLVSFVVPGE